MKVFFGELKVQNLKNYNMSWIDKDKELGVLNVGEKQSITFTFQGNLNNVQSVNSSCGCVIPYLNKSNNSIQVTYTPDDIPIHLDRLGIPVYSTHKEIYVNYIGGKKDILSFKAVVKRK